MNTADNKVGIDRDQEDYEDNASSSIHMLFRKIERCISMDRDSETEKLNTCLLQSSHLSNLQWGLNVYFIFIINGEFSIELDLTHHAKIKDYLCSAKLIGELDDDNSLQEYCNIFFAILIEEQLLLALNTKCTIDS